MTALSKAALQALWVQFFQPTQADFANLIDSWTDYSPALEVFGAKVSGGSTGVPNVVSSTSVAFVALGATGSDLMGAGTAASARTVIGTVSATETTPGIIEIATQAEANTGTDDTRALTPAKLANISPASVTFDTSDQVLILDASDSNKLKRSSVTFIPAGSVVDYAGTAAPTGWLLCAGQAVSRSTYADLFTAIGTTFGVGDGSTTFNLPDLRGRVVAGKDDMNGTAANRLTSGGSGITGTTLGASGGTQTHTLSTAEMPAHTHTAGFGAGTTLGSGACGSQGQTNTGSTGGGGAHQNTQPTLILNKIIKT